MNPHTRRLVLVIAGITESLCGAIEFFGKKETYGLAWIFLGIVFALAGMPPHKEQ